MTPDQTLVFCRFVVDGCALLLWGAHAFLWAVASPQLATRLQQRLRGIVTLAVMLLAIAASCKIPLQAAILGNGWPDAVNLSLIHDMIMDTRGGLAISVQMTTALLLAIVYVLLPARRTPSMTCCAGLMLASLVISGHAAMNSGLMGLLHQANAALHLLAVGAWIGALVPVYCLLTIKPDDKDWKASIVALIRFSTLGHGAVALTILTGVINSRLILGQFWLTTTIAYQRLLVLKIAVVAVMVGIACINRYIFVPGMMHDRQRALRLLRLGTVLEIGLSLCALALVATFGVMEPS